MRNHSIETSESDKYYILDIYLNVSKETTTGLLPTISGPVRSLLAFSTGISLRMPRLVFSTCRIFCTRPSGVSRVSEPGPDV